MTEHEQFAKFIDRTYDETFQLREEAKAYSTLDWKEDVQGLPEQETLRITGEKMRLTARLSEVMAWLMVHKAVGRGEMTPNQAQSGAFHLTEKEVCLADGRAEGTFCPSRLNQMLDRSFDLYDRVCKMDRMAIRLFAKSS